MPAIAERRKKRTVPWVAERWGVSTNKVSEFIKLGLLRAIDLASPGSTRPRYAIDDDDIDAFERSRLVVPELPQPRTRRKRRDDVKDYFA